MKIGFVEWGIGGMSIPEKVRIIAQMGFESISLHPFFSNKEEEEETKEAIVNLNFCVTFHTTNEPLEEILKKIDEYISTISSFHKSTGKIRCFSLDPYYLKDGDSIKLALDVMRTVILKSIEKLKPLGIQIAVENGHLLTLRQEFELLINEVGQKDFGILLDLGHMNIRWLRGGMPVDEYIYSLPLEIFELHIHDNDGEKDLHQLLGTGDLELKTIVKALKRRKFDGVGTIEIGAPVITGDAWMEAIKKTKEIFLSRWREDTR